MNKSKFIKIIVFTILFPFLLISCKGPDGKFKLPGGDARKFPDDPKLRVKKNLEEGRGFKLMDIGEKKGGVFDFASSNELWRASIEVLDFVSFTNASYSGGILITDWFSGNTTSEENSQRELKITVRFLTNEIRADGIKVVIHEKVCSDKVKLDCNINKIKSSIGNDIKLAILKKAALLKKESETKSKK